MSPDRKQGKDLPQGLQPEIKSERRVIYNEHRMLDGTNLLKRRPGFIQRFIAAEERHERCHGVGNPWELDDYHKAHPHEHPHRREKE